MADGRALGRLLVACAMGDGAPISSDLVNDARGSLGHLSAAATHHGISMAVSLSLAEADIPESLRSELRSSYEFWTRHHLLMTFELARLSQALDAAGCRWLTMKGPVLSELVYPRNDLRSYSDLDLLVHREDFTIAVDVLERCGGTGLETDWELVLHELKGELNFAFPSRGVVDLHWSLLYDASTRSQFAWNDGAAMDRSVRTQFLPRIEVPTLDQVDTFLHLALHACLSGWRKLSWMRDLTHAGSVLAMDFDEVVRRSVVQNIGLPVGLIMRAVRRTLHAVPWDTSIEAALCGSSLWSVAVAGLDRVRPSERWYGGSLSGHLVFGATRSNTPDSVRQLTTRARAEIGILRTDPTHPWRQRFPSATSLIAQPAPQRRSGSLAFRDAYLAAVGRMSTK